jgi:hypothetical protein
MPALNFDQVWEAVRALDADQLQRLRSLLDVLLARGGQPFSEEDELELELLREGTLDSVPPGTTDQKSFEDWKPVEIKGKPLSETIIEERR